MAKGDYLAVALDLVGILVPGGTGFGQLSKPTQRIAGRLLIWIDETINIKSLIGKTGSWHKGSFSTAAESLYYHFKKHGKEVGAVSAEQYLRKAEAFKNNLRGASKYKVDGYVNGVFRYVKDGKYIDLAPDGTIISFGKR